MPWHPSFATQLREQDAQHQYFVELLDQLDVACQLDRTEAIESLLAELERYAAYHFACEELLMTAYDYPAETQQREHRSLLQQLATMRADPTYSRTRIRLFVYKWLTNHIQVEDRQLGRYVIERRQQFLDSVSPDDDLAPTAPPTLLTDAANTES